MKACALCGESNPDVRAGLVEWIDPIEEQRFAAVYRCQDRKACRERVEASGGEWEVREGRA